MNRAVDPNKAKQDLAQHENNLQDVNNTSKQDFSSEKAINYFFQTNTARTVLQKQCYKNVCQSKWGSMPFWLMLMVLSKISCFALEGFQSFIRRATQTVCGSL